MPKILVVEDEPTILENIVETLTLEGFEVRGAANGVIGVSTASEYQPDLVVCDVMMPELNGYGVLMELRNRPQTARLPFIFLTAKAEREDMRRGMDLGADDYLTKPFTTNELLKAVKTRLDRHEAIKQPIADQMDELRQNITRALPHELRTPLTGIIGYSEMLLMDTDDLSPVQLRSMIQTIYNSGMRLYRVIENYLLYAQLELLTLDSARVEAMRTRYVTNTEKLVTDASLRMAEKTERQNDLHVEVESANIRIASENLSKIVEELVENAFKFSEAGTPVQVIGKAQDGFFTLTITDQGRGITAEQIESIGAYMQFQRKLYEQQGLGLGLIISQRLAELHNGQVRVESVPTKGTTVYVTLPTE